MQLLALIPGDNTYCTKRISSRRKARELEAQGCLIIPVPQNALNAQYSTPGGFWQYMSQLESASQLRAKIPAIIAYLSRRGLPYPGRLVAPPRRYTNAKKSTKGRELHITSLKDRYLAPEIAGEPFIRCVTVEARYVGISKTDAAAQFLAKHGIL